MRKQYASADDINRFLSDVKKAIALPNGFYLHPKKKNMDDIAFLGVNPKHEIRTLTYKEYNRGPEPDHIGDGTVVWEFVKNIDGILVYIKLKLDNNGRCRCLSFHQAERSCRLPYS